MNTEMQLKLGELLGPINKQIMMCNSQKELLMLCFAMMNRSAKILDQQLGADHRKELFREHSM